MSGKNFAIVDESVSKAIYGSVNQNVGYDVYATAFLETNAAIHFRLVAATGDGVSGCYYLQSVKADGTDYSIWGGGYLNTTPEGGNNCVFIMGLNSQNGQDCLNGAVWEITEETGGTFSIKNKGTGKYLKDNGPALNDGKTYFSLYTLKEHVDEDPLATEKADLQDAIDKGKLQNSFAKTAASFEVLTSAITAGEAEVVKNSPDTDAEKLGACKQAILDAIDGLVLENGYTNLTTNMYKTWDSATAPTTSEDAGCDYVLNESTGQPYGDSSVKWYHYADMSDFTSLTILAPAGTPRIMMNREEGEPDGGDYVEITTAPTDGKVTVNLTNYDYAHMNAIKGANWANVTVTGMYLYREITVTSAGYATFGSLYKNAKPNSVTAYAAKYNSSTKEVVLTEVENVPAGKGVIIEGSAGSYAPTFDVEASNIDSDLEVSNGTVTGDGSTIFVLGNGESGIGFYKLKEGNVLEAGKAYLKIPGGISSARGIRMVYNSITDVNEVKAQVKKQGAKGVYYNLSGQRVSKPTKGLYIVDGKVVSFN